MRYPWALLSDAVAVELNYVGIGKLLSYLF